MSRAPFLATLALLALAGQASALAAEAAPRFDILEIRVLGNTTLPSISVERAVYPYLGPGKTLEDVQSARAQLELSYREAGYGTVFVDIPEQQVDGGIVRLRVTEGRLDRVRISGARYFSNGQIRASLPALVSGAAPRLPDIQEQLTALNSTTRDRSVVPVLKAGRTPGTVDVELKVSDTLPVHGSVEVNNRYTANTSQLRLNGSIGYGNLFQRQQSLTIQYQVSPQEPSETSALIGSYAFRLSALQDTTFAVYAVDSNTDVAALGTLSVLGNGQIYGVRATHTLPAVQGYSHNATFGLDYKDFLEDIRLVSDPALVTPIHYLNWSLVYSGTRQTERMTNVFNIGANLGVRGVVNHPGEFADKRFKGSPNYFYLRGAVQHLQRLPANFQLFGRLSGQYTTDPLVSNEQMALGGADTVRGYLESSVLGDRGFNASFEVRNDWLARLLNLPPTTAYFAAFFDVGAVELIDPLPSQDAHFDLASWGFGLHVANWHGIDLALEGAKTLRSTTGAPSGDERILFSLGYGF